jgi:hypothetical protein
VRTLPLNAPLISQKCLFPLHARVLRDLVMVRSDDRFCNFKIRHTGPLGLGVQRRTRTIARYAKIRGSIPRVGIIYTYFCFYNHYNLFGLLPLPLFG